MKKFKWSILFWVIFMYCVINNINVYATDQENKHEEIDLPENLDFSVNNACSGHTYFTQFSACENGSFAVATHYYVDDNPIKGYTFRKQYIDIYDINGVFVEELSFIADDLYTIRLRVDDITIIFKNFRLVYDLNDKELHCYSVSGDDDAYLTVMDRMEYVCGSWNYRWEKSSLGYKTLIRSNGDVEQVIVDLPGTYRYSFWYFVITVGMPTIIFFVIIYVVKKRKKCLR